MRILIVEDEAGLAQPLLALLRQERYEAVWASSLEEAYAHLETLEPDLIVLDIMFPAGQKEPQQAALSPADSWVDAGFEFAQAVRAAGYTGSILFLSARDAVEDRVRGLDLGGDDYLLKPFSLSEFLARVRALLRRNASHKQSQFERGPLRVDFAARQAFWQHQRLELSEKEFALLELLAMHPGRVFTVEELLERFFPQAESGHRILRVYVHRLREKIAPEVILTMPGGYRLGL
ncbi:MAG TPA: response regulator transcription factor [Meiothermus sp.]|jgi:DNA-binding response OmpR family regulator|nr:response regulator transcription factor [Meiothermus sp.]